MSKPRTPIPLLSALLCLAFLSACGGGSGGSKGAPNNPPPAAYVYAAPQANGDLWETAHADSVGMSAAKLEETLNSVFRGFYPIVDAVAVARNGKLILAETIRTRTNDADRRVNNSDIEVHVQNSASKSFASALIGIAIDQGVIGGTDVPYLSLFDYPNYANWDARKNDITLHDVLTMRHGLDYNEWSPPYSDPDNQMFRMYAEHADVSKGLLDLPMASDPDSEFAYSTIATVSLGQAIENRAPLSLIDYGAANFLMPLGMTKVEVQTTPSGLPDLGRGLFITTRDLLKLGQVYLDDGQWQGQQIVSSDWVSRSTTAYTDIGWANPDGMAWRLEGYGYQWWLGSFDIDGRTVQSYAAWGFGEQWLMVVPEFDLVVAVNSHGQNGSSAESNQALQLIREIVRAAN